MLMRNDGTVFTNVTPNSGFDLFTGTSIEFVTHDFDNDGYLDVLGGGALMINNRDMTFTQTVIPASNGPIGDLNNDGFLDIQNDNAIYMNSGNDNHWIKVITTGTTSNKNGIGARVEVTSAMGTQIRDVRSGDGFRYMSSLTTHFGLGPDDVVTGITVRWPSGIVDQLMVMSADTTVNIIEGGHPMSITGTEKADDFTIYPVPVKDLLHIRSTENLENSNVLVFDITGKKVLNTTVHAGSLDVSSLNSGVYMLQVQHGGQLTQQKFTKL